MRNAEMGLVQEVRLGDRDSQRGMHRSESIRFVIEEIDARRDVTRLVKSLSCTAVSADNPDEGKYQQQRGKEQQRSEESKTFSKMRL